MEKYDLKNKTVQFHNILFASTSKPDYQMDRTILLEGLENLKHNEYVVVEGYHCSCYDFDDCRWEATKYTCDELIKLAESNKENSYYDSDSNQEMYKYVLENLK